MREELQNAFLYVSRVVFPGDDDQLSFALILLKSVDFSATD
jgi:hypothetical protein